MMGSDNTSNSRNSGNRRYYPYYPTNNTPSSLTKTYMPVPMMNSYSNPPYQPNNSYPRYSYPNPAPYPPSSSASVPNSSYYPRHSYPANYPGQNAQNYYNDHSHYPLTPPTSYSSYASSAASSSSFSNNPSYPQSRQSNSFTLNHQSLVISDTFYANAQGHVLVHNDQGDVDPENTNPEVMAKFAKINALRTKRSCSPETGSSVNNSSGANAASTDLNSQAFCLSCERLKPRREFAVNDEGDVDRVCGSCRA